MLLTHIFSHDPTSVGGNALALCLPVALLKPEGLPWTRVPSGPTEARGLLQTQAPHGLAKVSGHVKSTQGMSLEDLALVMREAYVSGPPQNSNNQRDNTWQATIPRA